MALVTLGFSFYEYKVWKEKMKKEIDYRKAQTNEDENLIRLISIYSPEDVQQFLNDVDTMLCDCLDLEKEDLPWINPDKHNEKWEKIIRSLRIVAVRLCHERGKAGRILH